MRYIPAQLSLFKIRQTYILYILRGFMRSIHAVILLLLVLMTSAQCQETAENLVNKGLDLNKQGKYDEAIKAYDEAIRLDPNAPDAWYNKGLALYSQKKYDESIDAYDEAIRLNPDLVAAWNNKGIVLNCLGMYDNAIKAFDVAILLDSKDAEAWSNEGIALDALGRNTEADVAFAMARSLGIRTDPNI